MRKRAPARREPGGALMRRSENDLLNNTKCEIDSRSGKAKKVEPLLGENRIRES